MTQDIVREAKMFAFAAHTGRCQMRKYTNEPYIAHPEAVAKLVMSVPHTPEMLCAAWLHDVVEDTGVTNASIRHFFGPVIAEYVEWLSDVSKPEDGNRAVRKALDRDHIARCPFPDVKTVKLADIIDNTSSICKHDPKFAKVYLPEKKQLLEVLREGDPYLWNQAQVQIDHYTRGLDAVSGDA